MKIKSHSKLQNPFYHYVHLQNWTIWEKWIEKNPPKFNLFLKSLEANYHSDIWTILLHIPICMNEIPSCSMYEHIDSKMIPNSFKHLNSFHSLHIGNKIELFCILLSLNLSMFMLQVQLFEIEFIRQPCRFDSIKYLQSKFL